MTVKIETLYQVPPLAQLYHISFQEIKEPIWYPKLPDGKEAETEEEKKKEKHFPEPSLPRICFSDSVLGCFWAIYPNISKLFENPECVYLEFNVYTPKFKGTERVLYPDDLALFKIVHDAHATREYCSIDPVEMKFLEKVRVYKDSDDLGKHYHPFNDATLPQEYLAPYPALIRPL